MLEGPLQIKSRLCKGTPAFYFMTVEAVKEGVRDFKGSLSIPDRKKQCLESVNSDRVNKIIYLESAPIDGKIPAVTGFKFDPKEAVNYDALFESYATTGFQATNLHLAIQEIRRMITWNQDGTKCKIFLGYTSNLVSSGLREIFRFLAEHKMVDVIVTTAGGIEEDFIKVLTPMFMGDFRLDGAELRRLRHNRTGNMIMPNNNYAAFERWMAPILQNIADEKYSDSTGASSDIKWTPSRLINILGMEIGKEPHGTESIYYWAWKNEIPVFCPALTDGAFGEALYYHNMRSTPIILDYVEDRILMDGEALSMECSGAIVLGGGVPKHHILNANIAKDGLDFYVNINTAQEFDGSDAGADPDESVSWGKISSKAGPVKVYGDATLLFPFVVAQTFHKHLYEQQK